jgi:C-methyltransferase C-terminal domain/Putative zinc binding domain/Methyltransferase domain
VAQAELSKPEPTSGAPTRAGCRFCGASLEHTVVDLGMSPLCESFVHPERANEMEPFYPLHVWVCDRCLLVQLEEYVRPDEIFTEYAYFSSFSTSWVEHARRYADEMVERLGLSAESLVVEVGSNDGYLLQHFVELGVPVLGIEPAANVAASAVERGIPTLVEFFGEATATRLAAEGRRANLALGNNVLAQVPDLNDFVAGLAALLADDGVLTLEFPHLVNLIEGNQFDTIYHEHFSYFSLLTTRAIFEAHGLELFDVDELPTHGGSLRVYGQRQGAGREVSSRVGALLRREEELGFATLAPYASFAAQVEETKRALLEFLIEARRRGKTVVGYGAPGKGNTLLNYCGIRTDFLDYTVDRNPYKHGLLLPGTRIPIHPPERIAETKPDYILILPWNLRDEIVQQLAYAREWGAEFVIPIPTVEVV